MRRRTPHTLAAVVVAAALLTGCASTDEPVCQSLDAVEHSVDQLRDANLGENGLSAMRGYLAQLRSDLADLSTEARGEFQTEIDAFRSAVNDLSSTVAIARADPSTTALDDVRTALAAARTSVEDLGNAMDDAC
jgi:hypothetical protein